MDKTKARVKVQHHLDPDKITDETVFFGTFEFTTVCGPYYDLVDRMAAWHLYLTHTDAKANPENISIIQHNNSRDAAQYVVSTAKTFIPLNRTKNIFPPVAGYEVKPNEPPNYLLENDKNNNDGKESLKEYITPIHLNTNCTRDITEESPQW